MFYQKALLYKVVIQVITNNSVITLNEASHFISKSNYFHTIKVILEVITQKHYVL
jgi:hypothetical protein